MAFVSSFVPAVTTRSSLAGDAVSSTPSRPHVASTVTMEAYSMDKYARMNDDARPPAPKPKSSGSSAYWTAYRDSLKEKFSPFRGAKDPEITLGRSTASILAQGTPYFNILAMTTASRSPGGDPEKTRKTPADTYMARCVTDQYKAMANPTGVYSMSCTEGAAKGEAEQSRELSILASYRQKQRSTAQKYFDLYESRKHAVRQAHGCHYEEAYASYPLVAKAMIRGYSEAKQLCVRYNTGVDYVKECGTDEMVASAYMANTIDMQYKKNAVPFGVYTGTCADGNQSGLADFKRIQANSARYRAGMMPEGFKAQSRYDAKKYALSQFRACSYEEAQFLRPAVAASMRPLTARY